MEEDQQKNLAMLKLIHETILAACEKMRPKKKDQDTSLDVQSQILIATKELTIQKTTEMEQLNTKTEDLSDQQVQFTEHPDNEATTLKMEMTFYTNLKKFEKEEDQK